MSEWRLMWWITLALWDSLWRGLLLLFTTVALAVIVHSYYEHYKGTHYQVRDRRRRYDHE